MFWYFTGHGLYYGDARFCGREFSAQLREATSISNQEVDDLLRLLKQVERDFGRRRGGQRWSARVLDLDLVLWSGGAWSSPGLTVPHIAYRDRDFVLAPALAVAADWRDPVSNLSIRHLKARLTRPRPMPR